MVGNEPIKKLSCRVCQKKFSKAEHLKRHERSHTGARPFVCKECKRAFARQDALSRHERLHARDSAGNAKPDGLVSTGPLAPEPDLLRPHASNSVDSSAQNDEWSAFPSAEALDDFRDPSAAGLDTDFSLIWPGSEDLYQTITSSDAAIHWQMPLGTLPLPPGPQQLPNNVDSESLGRLGDRDPSIGDIPSGGSHQAVKDVTEMITNSSSNVTAAVDANSITSVFLDECLHMFFARFIPTFPVLHRATFVFRECTHPLLLHAIAIGSLYLGPRDAATKGEALWRLAHTAVSTSWQKLITHRGPYDDCKGVQLVLAALLSQVYGILSKNRAIRTTSQIFRAHGFHWARHCGMFDSEPYSPDRVPSPAASDAEKDHEWRTWVAREIQRRGLLAYYILDGLASQMASESTSIRHTANPLDLPSSDATFQASSADEWVAQMHHSSKPDQLSFRMMFRSLFPNTPIPQQLTHAFSAFSTKVILEGIQSLLSDCGDDEFAAVGSPAKSDVRRGLTCIYENIRQNVNLCHEERLELLLRWHGICLDSATSSSLLCISVCSAYNITQHVVGSGTKRSARLLDLANWARTESARRALLHAVAIQDIVEQLPRGRAHVIHMPSSLFAAATVYSVFCLAGSTRINTPRSVVWKDVVLLEQELFTAAEADSTPSGITTSTSPSDTRRYVRGEGYFASPAAGTTRNVLYELNSMQKLFRCLFSQWGIAHDMEELIDRWITLCH